ncbi:MAG: oxidoreductase [Bacteroidetes bacterium]|nr:oxidoreductase [Bacteroidota bacterium]MCB9226594.1 oxidoreductase [Chitinophagales bacterium]
MKKTLLIAGSSGLVGNQLLQLMLENNSVAKVYTLVRKTQQINHPKLEEIIFDFNDNNAYQNLPKIDATFCCLGTTIKKAGSQQKFEQVDFQYPLQLAKNTKSSAFSIISAMGADSHSSIFYNKIKGKLEDELKKLNFDTLNIFQPSLLVGNRAEHRLGESIAIAIMPKLDFLLVGGLKKYRSIKAENVAKAMLKATIDNLKSKTYTSDEIQALADNYINS